MYLSDSKTTTNNKNISVSHCDCEHNVDFMDYFSGHKISGQ